MQTQEGAKQMAEIITYAEKITRIAERANITLTKINLEEKQT